MISRNAFLALAVLGLLGFAGKAHAAWWRVSGSQARQQETDEEFTRRASKYVKAPVRRFDDRAVRRTEAESRRVTQMSSRKYKPVVFRTVAAATHAFASKSLGAVKSIADRIGGSLGHARQASNWGRMLKSNMNISVKSGAALSSWFNSWKGDRSANANKNSDEGRIFAFAN